MSFQAFPKIQRKVGKKKSHIDKDVNMYSLQIALHFKPVIDWSNLFSTWNQTGYTILKS